MLGCFQPAAVIKLMLKSMCFISKYHLYLFSVLNMSCSYQQNFSATVVGWKCFEHLIFQQHVEQEHCVDQTVVGKFLGLPMYL